MCPSPAAVGSIRTKWLGRMQAPDLIAGVAALTVVALALRLRGIEEGLWRDEPVTFAETQGRSLRSVLDVVANGGEYNPPLPFVLAWLTSKAGDPTVSIRIPSVLLGTATVPIVFLLGLRTLGRAAALVAAGLIALSPFAIYYGIEARGYGALMCFSALSALVLVLAVETNRARWWIAYGLAVAAVLYTHYTGVFVIGVQGAWALLLHRGRWRGLVLAYLGAALLYLPWLPHVHGDPSNLKLWGSLTGRSHWEAFLQWAAGSPEVASSALPGVLALGADRRRRRGGPGRESDWARARLAGAVDPAAGARVAGRDPSRRTQPVPVPAQSERVPPVRGVARWVGRDPARQGSAPPWPWRWLPSGWESERRRRSSRTASTGPTRARPPVS